jgi:sugar-specific transcriptional regulator TrmB
MQLNDTKDIHALTAELGLTLNESEVYFFLMRHGLTLGADIYTQLGMDKSSCYRALHALREKGLVYKVGEERNQQFGASDLEMLFGLIESKKHALEKMEKGLQRAIEELKNNLSGQYSKKNITVIDGEVGYKLYMEMRLRSKEALIRELSGRIAAEQHFDNYDGYMKDYIKRRVKKGIWLNQLVPFGELDSKWERSSKTMMKEARELPSGFEAGAVLSTWDDKTGFFSKEGNVLIGFVLKDPLISNLMNSVFDFIWNTLN